MNVMNVYYIWSMSGCVLDFVEYIYVCIYSLQHYWMGNWGGPQCRRLHCACTLSIGSVEHWHWRCHPNADVRMASGIGMVGILVRELEKVTAGG